jgi:hypothetical protein
MGSKRGKKAKKRAQREARRQTRRAQHATRETTRTTPPDPQFPARHAPRQSSETAFRDPHIGYVAGSGMIMICDGDACIVAGSQEKMRQIVERIHGPSASQYTIQATTFEHIRQCMQFFGAAYCFDEEAYGRFLGPAQRCGIPVTEQDFSDPGPLGMHFVRVQLFT